MLFWGGSGCEVNSRDGDMSQGCTSLGYFWWGREIPGAEAEDMMLHVSEFNCFNVRLFGESYFEILIHTFLKNVFATKLFLFSSVHFSHSVMSNSLQPHGLQHARLPWLSPNPGAYSNWCTSSWWCHPTISSSLVPFSCRLQSFPISGFFPMSQFFASGSQSIGVSASVSVLPVNIQDWFPLGLSGLISLQSKALLESSPIPQFKSISSLVLSFLYSPTHIHTWPLEKS